MAIILYVVIAATIVSVLSLIDALRDARAEEIMLSDEYTKARMREWL